MAKAEENPFVNSPMNFNRSAPTGVNAPSFTLPQNHTLATDPWNQQAQMLSLGMPVAAFDASGGNNGYFSQAMMEQSPLMRNYSGNGLYSSNFLTNGLGMGMPGWQSNGDNSFTATQANPFAAINYNNGRTVAPNLNQGSGAPGFTEGQNAQQGYFTPEYISNAQSVGLSPEAAYAYQNNPYVKAYFDALNAQQSAAGSQNILQPATQQRSPFMATAPQTQQLTSSPVVPGTNMNQREYDTMRFDGVQATQPHYDALSQQSQAALRTRALLGGDPMSTDVLSQGGGMTGGISSGYINPKVLAYAKANPDSLQAKQIAAALGPNWNQG